MLVVFTLLLDLLNYTMVAVNFGYHVNACSIPVDAPQCDDWGNRDANCCRQQHEFTLFALSVALFAVVTAKELLRLLLIGINNVSV